MKGAFLLEVSKRIRFHRKEKQLTLQDLADLSNISKGLLSQIENGRSIPSLPVLFSIIQSLGLELSHFFEDLSMLEPKVIVQRKEDYKPFEKEDVTGYHYRRILTKNIPASAIDIVLLELSSNSDRDKVTTDAFEYKYILEGEVDYIINGETYHLNKGDSIFFDGRFPHVPINRGNKPCLILIAYFFNHQ